MTDELNRFLAFPRIPLPSIWNDDDSWMTSPSTPSGIAISEDEQHVYIETALPGLDPKDIDITYENDYLWIKGEAKEEDRDPKRKYYRQATKSFSYRIAVPTDVDTSIEPDATFKHGMMTVTFQKSPKSQPKKIQIKAS